MLKNLIYIKKLGTQLRKLKESIIMLVMIFYAKTIKIKIGSRTISKIHQIHMNPYVVSWDCFDYRKVIKKKLIFLLFVIFSIQVEINLHSKDSFMDNHGIIVF